MPRSTILVIDDEPNILTTVRRSLDLEGYQVEVAGGGAAGLAKLAEHDIDLVLLDVMMPGKSGWEVARSLKQDPETQGVKIVMVTAIGEKTNEITAPIYGADAHIDKPFEFEKLERVITQLLG
jgi:DNA-binding response OmpR family regulator